MFLFVLITAEKNSLAQFKLFVTVRTFILILYIFIGTNVDNFGSITSDPKITAIKGGKYDRMRGDWEINSWNVFAVSIYLRLSSIYMRSIKIIYILAI